MILALCMTFCLSSPARAGASGESGLPFDIPADLRDAAADVSSATMSATDGSSMTVIVATTTAPASEPQSAPPPARRTVAAWVRMPTSLLLYDSSGTLVQEIGIGQWQDEVGGLPRRHTGRGGASKDGRFAWSWEKIEAVPPPVRPGALPTPTEKPRVLTYRGTDGHELWHDYIADAPQDLEPASQSADGEIALVLERGPDGWTVAAFDLLGDRLLEAHNPGVVELAEISPQGRFACIRWHPNNQPPVYSHIDIAHKVQRFLKLTDVPPAPIRIDDDGRVFAGDKAIFEPK